MMETIAIDGIGFPSPTASLRAESKGCAAADL
jgi:hypothetical protein